jgi:hypothetical protein
MQCIHEKSRGKKGLEIQETEVPDTNDAEYEEDNIGVCILNLTVYRVTTSGSNAS